MPIVIIVVIILILVAVVIVKRKINNALYRGKQQVLNKVGIGNASITQSVDQGMEKIALNKLLESNPNLTEQYVKDTLYNYSIQIISRQNNPMFGEKVIKEMMDDKNLDIMRNMQFKRVNIISYINNYLTVRVIYSDGRDEYQMILNVFNNPNGLYLDSYSSNRGEVVGL